VPDTFTDVICRRGTFQIEARMSQRVRAKRGPMTSSAISGFYNGHPPHVAEPVIGPAEGRTVGSCGLHRGHMTQEDYPASSRERFVAAATTRVIRSSKPP
jgi:hypothetical protein